jgi:hypothetical protein
MNLFRLLPVTALALTMGFAHPVSATHKPDHRYTVWGEIKYEDGEPAANVTIYLMVKDGEPLGESKTDYRGRYRISLHVHNEDLYKVFDMKVNNVHRKVRLLFSPNDRKTERGQRVDVTVKREGEYDSSAVTSE